jgi:hypothetical protein
MIGVGHPSQMTPLVQERIGVGYPALSIRAIDRLAPRGPWEPSGARKPELPIGDRACWDSAAVFTLAGGDGGGPYPKPSGALDGIRS